MTRYAVLLRGINVGSAHRVAMAELRALLIDEGYGRVATLLQSGNVVLETEAAPAAVATDLEHVLEQRFGFPIPVIVRTQDELATVVARNPLAEVATDGSKYVVSFFAEIPDHPLEDDLAGVDLGDDRFVVVGTEMYIWCPQGLMKSPVMTALGKATGGPPATVRNWNTVTKLLALMP